MSKTKTDRERFHEWIEGAHAGVVKLRKELAEIETQHSIKGQSFMGCAGCKHAIKEYVGVGPCCSRPMSEVPPGDNGPDDIPICEFRVPGENITEEEAKASRVNEMEGKLGGFGEMLAKIAEMARGEQKGGDNDDKEDDDTEIITH